MKGTANANPIQNRYVHKSLSSLQCCQFVWELKSSVLVDAVIWVDIGMGMGYTEVYMLVAVAGQYSSRKYSVPWDCAFGRRICGHLIIVIIIHILTVEPTNSFLLSSARLVTSGLSDLCSRPVMMSSYLCKELPSEQTGPRNLKSILGLQKLALGLVQPW